MSKVLGIQSSIFENDTIIKEESPFNRLSSITNMTEKAEEVVNNLSKNIQENVFHFIRNASRQDSFALLRIIKSINDQKISRVIDEKGVGVDVCLECGHKSRIYKRKIRYSHIQDLVKLYNLGGYNKYFHISLFSDRTKSSDFFLVKLFGLAEQKQSDKDPSKKENGLWRLTTSGRDFLEGNHKIPLFIEVRENKIIGKSKEMIFPEDLFRSDFDGKENKLK